MNATCRSLLVSGLRCLSPRLASIRRVATETNEQRTHFGFEEVTAEEKLLKGKFRWIKEVFSNVAQKYDLMNDVMSAGIHRYWKDRLIETLDPLEGTRLLDVAGGTGDVAFRFLKRVTAKEGANVTSSVVVCDINENMLKVGQQRAEKLGYNKRSLIEWVEGDAQELPFPDNSFDAFTIAFGIRNVVDVQRALDESHRVLKRGGIFLCLEFSKVQNPLLQSAYDWYSMEVIPVIGEVVASDYKSYKYLVESIRRFPDQQDFKAMIEQSGYSLVEVDNLMGGIAAIHSAFKK